MPGYDVSAPLREYLEMYGELTVTWPFRAGETYLKVAVEEALDVPTRSVRIFRKRLVSRDPVHVSSSCC